MSLGLFVEGESDLAAIPILVRKLGYQSGVRARKMPRGDMLRFDKVRPNIINLIHRRSDIDLVIVCIDADDSAPNRLLTQEAMPVERRLNRDSAIHVPVRFAVIAHALEGWLACDEDALRSVLGGSRARVNIRGNPENHPAPADLMKQLFRDNGRVFKKTQHDPLIAEHTSPERIAARSPTFRRFAEILGRPISR